MFDNASFYPTPAEVADAMLANFDPKDLGNAKILEPSAGKGDLADAIVRAIARPYSHFRYDPAPTRESIHCVELDLELQATLRGKGYTLVGTDFLEFTPDERYDLIIMNPPFADGVKHLLHAWDILDHGDIYCLLNAQSVQNPCTAERRLLLNLIEEHGDTTDMGPCFASAERKTSVHVTLVHLRKEEAASVFHFEAGPDADPYAHFEDGSALQNELATRDLIGNLVADFNHARELFMDVSGKLMELGHYMHRFMPERVSVDASKYFDTAAGRLLSARTTQEQEEAFNLFVRGLKKDAWNTVFRLTRFRSLVSEGVSRELDRLQEENARMAFSKVNIMSLLETLIASRERIAQQCILEAFDWLTRYHKENRVHVEGWLTNDAWKVNQRVVVPYGIRWFFDHPALNYDKERALNDLDRALASLEGRTLDTVPVPTAKAVDAACREYGARVNCVAFESTYFELRAYKKGTLHLRFLDKDLLERFNMAAARGKSWLPDDYKARRREEATRTRRAEQCSLPM